MSTYAGTTASTPEQSRAEIEAALKRYGCDAFQYTWDGQANINALTFRVNGRVVRLFVPIPDADNPADMAKSKALARKMHASTDPKKAHEQAVRQRWRAMLLYVKAILEAIENNLTTLDQALMSSVLLANGQTIGQFYGPQIERAALEGRTPPMLTGGSE